MAAQEISKKYQTAPEASWRFGGFLLDPGERLLLRGSTPVPLTPRSFDTLLCLVSRAGRLVTKEELMQTVWPGTFVTEANLTNAIVSLRKIVGRDAIRTVSKHGYRFELPVEGEPGIPQPTYQLFSRARELTSHRSLAGVTQARELLWLCIANDPGFAPAWAWLGRACALLAKFSQDGSPAQAELAQAAFHRAFALDPDLACAHQFYTSLQTDMGQARQAMQRLAERLRRHPSDPETCAGLVQALRFCGLLDESIEAHRRAQDLDPTIHTSVAHSWFLKAEYGAAIESYSGRAALYLDAAAWAAMGHADRARDLLRQRLAAAHQSEPMNTAMASLLAIVEGRSSDAVALLGAQTRITDAEMLFYCARHHARLDRPDRAISAIEQASDGGFACSPQTLRLDPWLASVRAHPGYPALLRQAEKLTREAQSLWSAQGLPFAPHPTPAPAG